MKDSSCWILRFMKQSLRRRRDVTPYDFGRLSGCF